MGGLVDIRRDGAALGAAATRCGTITLIQGCMFSGKTTALLRRLNGCRDGSVRAFKHVTDCRYSADAIVSHDGESFPAEPIAIAHDIEQRVNPPSRLIAIDEAHFFDEDLVHVVRRLAAVGAEVIMTALDRGSWNQPMPVTRRMVEIADHVMILRAVCAQCGAAADHTQRLTPIVDGKLVGGPESYEPRCAKCWHAPPEPLGCL